MGFDDTCHFWSQVSWFYRIEKQSSRERALEHVESSGTKIMMRGPSKQRNRETDKLNLEEEYHVFHTVKVLFVAGLLP